MIHATVLKHLFLFYTIWRLIYDYVSKQKTDNWKRIDAVWIYFYKTMELYCWPIAGFQF